MLSDEQPADGGLLLDDPQEMLEAFLHLAHLALPLADLDAGTAESVRRDITFLRSEAQREEIRPGVVVALVRWLAVELESRLPAEAQGALHHAAELWTAPASRE